MDVDLRVDINQLMDAKAEANYVVIAEIFNKCRELLTAGKKVYFFKGHLPPVLEESVALFVTLKDFNDWVNIYYPGS